MGGCCGRRKPELGLSWMGWLSVGRGKGRCKGGWRCTRGVLARIVVSLTVLGLRSKRGLSWNGSSVARLSHTWLGWWIWLIKWVLQDWRA